MCSSQRSGVHPYIIYTIYIYPKISGVTCMWGFAHACPNYVGAWHVDTIALHYNVVHSL